LELSPHSSTLFCSDSDKVYLLLLLLLLLLLKITLEKALQTQMSSRSTALPFL
jgi:hypothetical protein